ncbi:MAG: hypothetical protein V4584_12880 [Verrucomicrobiota bacterium]
MTPKTFLRNPFLHAAGLSLITIASSQAAIVTQTISQASGANYNAVIWGTPAAAPTSGNDYVSGTGLTASASTGVGTTFTGTVRNINNNTFAGDSLRIVTDSRFQLSAGTATVNNLILDGGTIGISASGVVIAGTTTVNSVYLGTGGTQLTTINSNLLGAGTFFLRATDGTPTLTFGGTGVDFDGTLNIGWDDNEGAVGRLLVDFNNAYSIAGIVMNPVGSDTLDILNLDADVTVGSFTFNGSSLAPGTYNEAQLDAQFLTTDRFTGGFNLIVIPEPSAALLGALGSLALLRRRRSM